MKAFNDMILLEVDETPVISQAGIELPEESASALLGPISKVLKVGPKVDCEPPIKAGDWVLLDMRYVTNVLLKGEPYRYCRAVGVVAKLSQIEINKDITEIKQKVEPAIVPLKKPKIEIVN